MFLWICVIPLVMWVLSWFLDWVYDIYHSSILEPNKKKENMPKMRFELMIFPLREERRIAVRKKPHSQHWRFWPFRHRKLCPRNLMYILCKHAEKNAYTKEKGQDCYECAAVNNYSNCYLHREIDDCWGCVSRICWFFQMQRESHHTTNVYNCVAKKIEWT